MSHTISLRVWTYLLLVVVVTAGDRTATAGLFRGRRQRCCHSVTYRPCCPQPCYRAPRVEAGMCVITELYALPGLWIYYAHHHETSNECANFVGMVYQSSVERSPVPMICHDDCFDPNARTTATTRAGLPAPIGATEDFLRLMPNSQATKIDELAGNLVLPDGRRIHARIGFFKIKVPVNIGGVRTEVTEYFAFGFEAEDTGSHDFEAREVDYHGFGSGVNEQVQRNLIEFKIGTTTCVVLTVGQ